ncbi:hypothetical protein Y032_0421g1166 [Ancylostoma ceylanicum]|uniref:Serpin domain-containing protein n=1 Tax=Ancylostoma ceylanicum TaxID=53326 RepID=A0A016X138_9BILA|nr:hypothetical protein Y032_0421g1166 [Ancylostoma ceylanicum]
MISIAALFHRLITVIFSKNFTIEPQYADTITGKYAAKIIDAFVSDSTEGKIQNFITEDEVRGAFSLIINAVLFSAEWEHEFSKESVLSRTFHSGENVQKQISIPKMKIETDFDLKKALVAMGVTEMFTSSADLTGIAKSPPLMVSDAKHRGMIEIDEKGTTAAAATGLGMVAVSAIQNQPRRFVADHPFIFTLTKDNNPLFMGQFA